MGYEEFKNIIGFQWDFGNKKKNWEKHQVKKIEIEQCFFNEPIYIFEDEVHSQKEKRWYMLGRSDDKRFLFIVFTIRESLFRVISARDMNRKERNYYHEKI